MEMETQTVTETEEIITNDDAKEGIARRIHSFVWGGIVLAAILIFGLCNDSSILLGSIVLAITGFTFCSCLILNNNFVLDMVGAVSKWGFVTMPGLIFHLDLDGIIWFLTVKLLFWILGIVLALLSTILAIALGLVVSIFVYPYAIIHNFRHPEDC